MNTTMKRTALAAGVSLFALAPLAAITQAEPATNVSAQILSQATFPAFKVKTEADSPIEMHLKSRTPADVVVRKHTYAPTTGSTGWHKHPGPVFISVIEGELTYYDYDDPDCTPITVRAGGGFVDDGHGHLVRNLSGAQAVDVSVIMAPEKATPATFRMNLAPRTAECGF